MALAKLLKSSVLTAEAQFQSVPVIEETLTTETFMTKTEKCADVVIFRTRNADNLLQNSFNLLQFTTREQEVKIHQSSFTKAQHVDQSAGFHVEIVDKIAEETFTPAINSASNKTLSKASISLFLFIITPLFRPIEFAVETPSSLTDFEEGII